jgi:hypothetical protein
MNIRHSSNSSSILSCYMHRAAPGNHRLQAAAAHLRPLPCHQALASPQRQQVGTTHSFSQVGDASSN